MQKVSIGSKKQTLLWRGGGLGNLNKWRRGSCIGYAPAVYLFIKEEVVLEIWTNEKEGHV